MLKSLFNKKPEFKEAESLKVYYNVGGLLDIPTGNYIKGYQDENIMNGGLGVLTAIAGKGNTFKSTLAHFMLLSAMNKISHSGITSYANIYDTEMNIIPERIIQFSKRFDKFADIDIIKENIWSITDKTKHMGNEWYRILKDFLKNEKIKNKDKYMFNVPFKNPNGEQIKVMFPTFGEIDSVSEFETSDIEKIQNDNDLGDSGGNTIHMRLGLAKTRLLMELPSLCNSSAHYMVLTAHLGGDIPMQQGPYSVPTKKLQYLKLGEKIKGVTDKFFFLPNIFWQTVNSTVFLNNNTKGPEYPKTRESVDEGSTDLNIVTIKQLRSKSGPSGISIDLVVSQSEGVLPTLSEFHFIKENNRYGLEGNNVTYNLVLYPEVKFGRTTVRSFIDTDPLFSKAIKFTADLLQIKQYLSIYGVIVPNIKELYEKLDKKYGFKKLLETRDFWTFDHYENKVPFLSAMDLIEMYYDRYTPYWLK